MDDNDYCWGETLLDTDFWRDRWKWPDDKNGFTFLGNAALKVAGVAPPEFTEGGRLAWAAEKIAYRCANGDLEARFHDPIDLNLIPRH